MKILVTGSKGQLGSELQQIAKSSKHEFFFTGIEKLNICREQEVKTYFANNPVDLVINCAAYTAVDKAESEIDKALLVNATAPRILAEISHVNHAAIIHISTDFVFDGQNCRPYTEEDQTAPVNVYGQTKLEGENRLTRENPRSVIIRTSWLYSSYGNNFVKTMLKLAKEKDMIKVVNDQVGTPTYGADLASALLTISEIIAPLPQENNIWGVYHFSNEGVASWYDLAYELMLQSGIKTDVLPIRTMDFPTPAKRPHFSVMDKTRIKETFGVAIPHWKESLSNCLKLLD